MKKAIIKITIWLATFILALFVSGKIMNAENINLTTDMSVSTLPLITMEKAGVYYNQLHGYLSKMDIAYQQESITELGSSREISFEISTYGVRVDKVRLEVRNVSGDRLIENTEITDFNTEAGKISIDTSLKDLLEKDTKYSLTIVLEDGQGRDIRYYTNIIWSDSTKLSEKMNFVQDFHQKTLNHEQVKELSKYMESNSKGDNTTLHKVNIHSSLNQLAYGELNIRQDENSKITITELEKQTATIVVDSVLVENQEESEEQTSDSYRVQEVFRIRLSSDRVYLLDYERTMTQIPNMEQTVFQGDKISLGITEEKPQLVENDNGNYVAYVIGGNLYSYDLSSHKGAVVFSFVDAEKKDARDTYQNYEIKILDVNEEGDIKFAVYGYMNRGLHEGEVGLQLSEYHRKKNTIEEILYVPYLKSAAILENSLKQLLYLSEDGNFYCLIDQTIYQIESYTRKVTEITQVLADTGVEISNSHRVVTWTEGSQLKIIYLDNAERRTVSVGANESIIPLNFMQDDIIYGIVRNSEIYTDDTGHTTLPMYKLCICDMYGKTLKSYSPSGMYIVGCTVDENQITINQVKQDNSGKYVETVPEQIMSNEIAVATKNTISVVAIDKYEKYVQIKLKSEISKKNLQILTPKWVVYEVELSVELGEETRNNQLYVYGMGELIDVYNTPAYAVKAAYEGSGYVLDGNGAVVWLKGNRVTKNQIMAIKEKSCQAGESSLAVCLNTILEFEGISKDTNVALQQGENAIDILQEGMPDCRILDLEGCTLDAILYYVNQDIPVLATVENGQAVLVVGFNEFNVVIFEPSTGRLYKKGMNDSAEWFTKNGNKFITYLK